MLSYHLAYIYETIQKIFSVQGHRYGRLDKRQESNYTPYNVDGNSTDAKKLKNTFDKINIFISTDVLASYMIKLNEINLSTKMRTTQVYEGCSVTHIFS